MFFRRKTPQEHSKELIRKLFKSLRELERRRSELIEKENLIERSIRNEISRKNISASRTMAKDLLYIRKCNEKIASMQAYIRGICVRLQTQATSAALMDSLKKLINTTKVLKTKDLESLESLEEELMREIKIVQEDTNPKININFNESQEKIELENPKEGCEKEINEIIQMLASDNKNERKKFYNLKDENQINNEKFLEFEKRIENLFK